MFMHPWTFCHVLCTINLKRDSSIFRFLEKISTEQTSTPGGFFFSPPTFRPKARLVKLVNTTDLKSVPDFGVSVQVR